MSIDKEIVGEIRILTQHLVKSNICRELQFPTTVSQRGGLVAIFPDGSNDISSAMRNVPYIEAYSAARNGKAYNMILLDGALINLRYLVRPSANEIIKHSLSFWPSPRLLPLDNAEWIYEMDEPFGDAIDERGIIPVPIRFDYAPDQFVECEHSKCHATLGQYPNCRIPVSCPVRPGLFANFILSNFYKTEVPHLKHDFPFKIYSSNTCITSNEQSALIHMTVPQKPPVNLPIALKSTPITKAKKK